MKKQRLSKIGLFTAISFLLIVTLSPTSVKAQTSTISDELLVSEEASNLGIWNDQQWRFYKLVVNYREAVEINMTYTGDVDLDLRIYVDVNIQNDQPNEQDMLAWDVTGMGLRPEVLPMRNSQIRGKTDITEEVYYKNALFSERNVYVLVFCYEGVGSSAFTLNSNVTLSTVPNNALVKSEIITSATIIFVSAMVGATLITIITGKFLELPKKERKLKKLEKQKLKNQKKLEKEKRKAAKKTKSQKSVSMKKRMKG